MKENGIDLSSRLSELCWVEFSLYQQIVTYVEYGVFRQKNLA